MINPRRSVRKNHIKTSCRPQNHSGAENAQCNEDVIQELKRHHVEDEITDDDEPVPTRESIKHSWFRASQFPSEVHVELLKRQIIPNPYVAFNEHEVQCEYYSKMAINLDLWH